MNETWLPIKGYENYLISNHGRVARILKSTYKTLKTFKRQAGGYLGRKNAKLMYHDKVSLYDKDSHKPKQFFIHRLVAAAFIPNPNKYPIVNHKDGNSLNNNVNNLEWCTYSYNLKEAYRLGNRKGNCK